jgi:hypothetical protein
VTRYREERPDGTERYLAVYDLGEGRDAGAAAATLGAAAAGGDLEMTPAMDVVDNPPQMHWVRGL